MIVNPDKHHAMVIGTTEHQFSFPVEDSLQLLGMTINQLNFNEHVSLVCKKVNNQLNVMIRFHNLICTTTKLKLYNAFILPHFQFCSMVWHFCSARICDKLESLNKRALRIVFNDKVFVLPTATTKIRRNNSVQPKDTEYVNHYLQMFKL